MRQASAKPPETRQKPLPKLEVFRTYKQGLTMEQAIKEVNEASRRGPDRLRIATNMELNLVLTSDSWKSIRDAPLCWSGTMAAYEKQGVAFGRNIEYNDNPTKIRYVFPVPEEYRGAKNAILVCEHPDLSIEKDGKDRIIRAAKVSLLERFPVKNGWYLPDPRFGIPLGAESDDSSLEVRRLWRTEKRVGLVARGYYDDWGGYSRRGVFLDVAPSYAFGVVVVREKRELMFDGPDPFRSLPSLIDNDNGACEADHGTPTENAGLLSRFRKKLGF